MVRDFSWNVKLLIDILLLVFQELQLKKMRKEALAGAAMSIDGRHSLETRSNGLINSRLG